MSTKIYDAWVYAGSLTTLLAELTQFKPVADELLANAFGRDRSLAVHTAFDTGAEDLFTVLKRDVPEDEYKWSVSCFPVRPRQTAMIFFGPDNLQVALTKGNPKFKHFGYWDNTDPPDDVTDREWERRRKLWETVLTGDGKSGVPADHGYTYAPTLRSYSWARIDNILRNAPTLLERAGCVYTHRLTYDNAHEILTAYSRVREAIRDARHALRPELEAIAGGLRPLTREDFKRCHTDT